MSSILKALQRVEEERPSGAGSAPRRAVRGDFVAEGGAGLIRKRRRVGPSPVLWSSVGAALLLAGLVWWRLPHRAPEVVAAKPPPETRSVQPAEGGSAEAAAPEGAPSEGAVAPAPPVQQAERAAPPSPPPRAPRSAPAAVARAAQPPPAPPPVAAAAPTPEPEIPPPPELPPAVAERLPPLGVTLDAASPGEAAKPSPEAAPVASASAQAPAPATAAPTPAPVAEPTPPAPAAASTPKQAVAKPTPPAPAAASTPKPAVAKPTPKRPSPAVVAKSAPTPPPHVPAVRVERTSWHPSPGRRVAWVSVEGLTGTRELHEGDAVGSFVVKEINPSSVVFLHGADTIQRRVGEQP